MTTAHSPGRPARGHVSAFALALALLALLLAAVALTWALTRDEAETVVADGSGVAVTETRELEPFTAVELSGASAVTIGVGGEQRVVVRADDNLVATITTEVADGVLVIDQTGSFDVVTPMTVEITVPSLDGVRLNGSGTITVDGHDLGDLAIALPGAGSIVGAGSVTTLDVHLAGAGDIDLGNLVARDATVALSGSGTVLVQVTGVLEADVSGAGTITYTGEPERVDSRIGGTGSVTEG
jgi:hypothetical protein